MHDREFGSAACVGVAVPQANPIVEPEFQALAADGVSMLTTRLQGSRTNSKDRLVGYLDSLSETLDAYDTTPLDAVAFACTGVSYIVGDEHCEGELERLSAARGYPIISAASAIRMALKHMGVTKIAVFAPYPAWLSELSYAYWARAGFEVVASACAPMDPSDTRAVYKIRSVQIASNIAALDLSKAEVLILTGTGMPTLKAIPDLSKQIGKPVLSSNLCLAWVAMTTCGVSLPAATATEPLFSGWAARLRQ
jgi:maleate isomerase